MVDKGKKKGIGKNLIIGELILGIILFIFSLYSAVGKQNYYFFITVLGWLFVADAICLLLKEKSFFQLGIKKIIFLLVGGALFGGILEISGIYFDLWIYHSVSWLTVLVAYAVTMPTAFQTHKLINRLLKIKVNGKKVNFVNKNHNFILLISVILIIISIPFRDQPVFAFAIFYAGLILLIQGLLKLRKRKSFLEEIITNPKILVSIVIQAIFSAILVEWINTLTFAWEYNVLTYNISGIYPWISLGWIPLIINFISAYWLIE